MYKLYIYGSLCVEFKQFERSLFSLLSTSICKRLRAESVRPALRRFYGSDLIHVENCFMR